MAGFEAAIVALKKGKNVSRTGWKGSRKYLAVKPSEGDNLSYVELRYMDGRRAPWTPTRCDMLENDWVQIKWLFENPVEVSLLPAHAPE